MSYPMNASENEFAIPAGSQFDVKKFTYKVLGVLPWFILSVAIGFISSKIYLRYTLPVSKISAFLLIKSQEDGGNSEYKTLKEMGLVTQNNDVENEMDIIRSFSLMKRVVDSLHLNINLYKEGRVTASPIFGELSPIHINVVEEYAGAKPGGFKLKLRESDFTITERGSIHTYRYGQVIETSFGKLIFERNQKIKIEPTGYRIFFTTKESETKKYKSTLDVRLTHDMGGIVEISMLDEIPDRAIMIINKLIEVYNNAGLDDKNVASIRTIKFLNERIESVAKELNAVELDAQGFKTSNRINSISEVATTYLGQAVSVDNKKADQIGQIKLLESLENYLNTSKNPDELIPSSLGLGEPSLLSLIATHNSLITEKQKMVLKSTDADPLVANLKSQIKDIRADIIRNLKVLKDGFNTHLNQVENDYATIESKIAKLPGKERELVSISRQINLKENLYLYLLQKREESQLSLASNINNTRLVDQAFNTGVVRPIASQIQMFAFLIALAVPALILILRDFFNTKINERKEIEEGTAVPILGELSFEKNKKNIVIDNKSRTAISEQFRLIRTNLQYMGAEKPIKTILVSSFTSGEGKSFVSLNLASSIGITGAKTVILEFDLRKPKLSKYLNITGEFGISNYVVKDIPVQDLIKTVPGYENLHVVSCGPIPPNPAELLLSPKIDALLQYLRDNFDMIIIDTAPIGLVTDAFLLERFADATMFIVRHQYSSKTVIPFIEKLSKEKKLKSLSIVVNGIKNSVSFGYGYSTYGYSYSYGYGYGYGYNLPDRKRGFLENLLSGFVKNSD